jgi:hypothetical protein
MLALTAIVRSGTVEKGANTIITGKISLNEHRTLGNPFIWHYTANAAVRGVRVVRTSEPPPL